MNKKVYIELSIGINIIADEDKKDEMMFAIASSVSDLLNNKNITSSEININSSDEETALLDLILNSSSIES